MPWSFQFMLLLLVLGFGIMIHAEIIPYTTVTVIAGQNAHLNCELQDIKNHTIIWMRDDDTKLISSDLDIFASSERYKSIRDSYSGKFALNINDSMEDDSGLYQCHFATNSSIRAYVQLNVYRPLTRLLGSSEKLYIALGNTINLSCIVESGQNRSNLIIWFHNTKKINYDDRRLEWNEVQSKRNLTISTLWIPKALRSDGGTYTCVDAYNVTQNIILHIFDASLNGGNLLTRCFYCAYAWFVVIFIGSI